MDLWCVHVKSNNLVLRNPIAEKSGQPIKNSYLFPSRPFRVHRVSEIGVFSTNSSAPKGYSNLSLLPRATGAKNNSDSSSSSSGDNDQPNPEGDDYMGSNPSPEKYESQDAPSQKSHAKPLDWREFRALLYTNEQAAVHKQEKSSFCPNVLPTKWAHPLSAPENGCLLVATEKLDGVATFERTVILLLRSGTRNPQEGPFGIIINRPLHKKIKHMKPSNLRLATTFADCSLHFGGPLEASMFLLRAAETSDLTAFEEVIPGVCFGSRNNLDAAGGLIKKGMLKPQDFRFFYGYAGWQLDQLREEIDSEYWYVAACSANLLSSGSQSSPAEGLWEEILQLMGGHYSELSRKPKQDI